MELLQTFLDMNCYNCGGQEYKPSGNLLLSHAKPLVVRSIRLDLGVDPPSSRDPPFPSAVSATTIVSPTSGCNWRLLM
ncbi:hypothetical protein J5N97_001951 [Dioscorea zingiberensis]|uniref:Uncharacterized protein n=1 Tax=Dioscorea zingiberensis TaxID=325984 RepID=A0A9D5BST8_9LILI|nr:hypothetical protein J5N97_001951 [Dioscorea zingiberensis]